MKNLNYILLPILYFFSFSNLSGQVLEEGFIKMEITEVSSEDPQVAAQLEMMKGTEMNLYFNNEYALVQSEMLGGMMTINNITDKAANESLILFDAMGNKMYTKLSKEDMEAASGEGAEDNFKIEYFKDDVIEILGYKCHKASIKSKDASMPMNIEMYVTEQLKGDNKNMMGLNQFDLEGFPLKYTMDMGAMKMTFETTEISESVDTEVFKVDTTGYKLMSPEELKMMGGVGGMGF